MKLAKKKKRNEMNYYVNGGLLLCQVHERDLMGDGLIIRMLGAGEVVSNCEEEL